MKDIQSLFKELRKREIRLWLEGEKLRFNGPQGSLTPELKSFLVEKKSEIIAILKSSGQQSSDDIPLANVDKENILPVSFSQRRLLFMQQMEGPSSSYNIPLAFRFKGKMNFEALQQALSQLVDRHESFRTTFTQKDGDFYSTISSNGELAMARINIDSAQVEARESELMQILQQEAKKIFSIFESSLYRFLLVKVGEHDNVLMITMHHVISDGWSLGVLSRDLIEIYNSLVLIRSPELPNLTVQYADYTNWQIEWAKREDAKRLTDYWKHQLNGIPTLLELPTDFPRPPEQKYRGQTKSFRIDSVLYERLLSFNKANQSTLFMTLLAAFKVLLSRYSGQTDVVVGTTMANRRKREVENVIGFFMNTVVLRSNLDRNKAFTLLLDEVKQTVISADLHQDIPFEQLVEELSPKRSLSHSPLFQVMVIFNNFPVENIDMADLEVSRCPVPNDISKYDLTLTFNESEGTLSGGIEYNVDLFKGETIDRLLNHFHNIIECVCENVNVKIENISLLDQKEEGLVITQWNDTEIELEKDACIHQLIEKQVKSSPNEIAIIFEDESISYEELDNRANQLAMALHRKGVGPDVKVGVCLGRSIDLVVSLFAILKAGGAYVPLDPAYPIGRLSLVAADAELKFILTHSDLELIFQQENIPTFCIDRRADFLGDELFELTSKVSSKNIAYMIYTSGTTGKPKGVMVSHHNVVNFFKGLDKNIDIHYTSNAKNSDINPRPVWLSVTSISFDISVLELFWTLANGMKVILMPELPQGGIRETQSWRRSDKGTEHKVTPPKFSLFYFAADEQKNTDKYKLLVEGAKFADQNGFESVWVPERHFHTFGGQFPNPSVAASAISTITRNVGIRAGSIVAPLHNPIRIAEEWSMIDNLSKGRVGVAFASGWHFNDFVFAPENFKKRHEVLRKHVQQVQDLWKGESIKCTAGNGEEIDITVRPRAVQPELPTWITTAGNPETYQYAGSIGANILTHLLGQNLNDLRNNINIYRSSLMENGFDAGKGMVTLMVHTYIGDNVDDVKSLVKSPFKTYLKNSIGLLKAVAESEDLNTNVDEDAIVEAGFHRYFESSALFGTKESCLQMVQKIHQCGVDEIACLIDFGVDDEHTITGFRNINQLRLLTNAHVAQFNFKNKNQVSSPVDLMEQYKVDHLQCTPSFAKMIMNYPEGRKSCQSLKRLFIGGEAIPANLVSEYADILGDGEIFNMYGPTETTVWSAVRKITANDVRIGGPIANTKLIVLDANFMLVPVGVPGELYITGEGVTRGYWNRPGLTADRYMPDPWGEPGGRMYKTGDRARYHSDGNIEYLGRADFQVKYKGFRIETAEIEQNILDIPGILEAIVTVNKSSSGDERLVAYIAQTKNELRDELSIADIQLHLIDRLPEYMIPRDFVFLEHIPLTPNGKIDRNNLPALKATRDSAASGSAKSAPTSEMEIQISLIWKTLLQKENIGIYDNFFEIGGNSLLIAHMKIELEKLLDREVGIIEIFKHPTIESMSRYLGQSDVERPSYNDARKRAESRRLRMKQKIKYEANEDAVTT